MGYKWPIETAYQDYLKREGLTESEETRKIFFAGSGCMFYKLNSEGIRASHFTIDANIELNSFWDKYDTYKKDL